MPETFDPYTDWLGVPPGARPPDYYALLGAPRFTADMAALSRAADQRMAHVRSFQTGPRALYTQPLLNELAAARFCLTNPATKAAYDAQLRGQTAPPASVPMARLAMPAAPPVTAPPALATLPAPPRVQAPQIATGPGDDEEEPEAGRSWWPLLAAMLMVVVAGVSWSLWTKTHGPTGDPGSTSRPQSLPPPTETSNDAPPEKGVVVMQEADGGLNFRAETAAIHGENPRLELRGTDGVIVNWLTADDWLSWDFNVVKPGFFQVEIVYAADAAMAGGTYTLSVEDQEQTRSVKDTGGPGSFGSDTFYLVITRSGPQTLTVRPGQIQTAGLMAFQALRFTPSRSSQE